MNFCVCSMLPFLLNNLLTLFSFHFSLENICFSCYYKGFCDFTGVEESSNSFCMKYSVIWIISLLKRQCREIFYFRLVSWTILLLAFLLLHARLLLMAFVLSLPCWHFFIYQTIRITNSGLANWRNNRSIGLRPQSIRLLDIGITNF